MIEGFIQCGIGYIVCIRVINVMPNFGLTILINNLTRITPLATMRFCSTELTETISQCSRTGLHSTCQMAPSGDVSTETIKVYSYNLQACKAMKHTFHKSTESTKQTESSEIRKMEGKRREQIKRQIIGKIILRDEHEREVEIIKNVFFCLQEVCADMKQLLEPSFKARGYTMIFMKSGGSYGSEAIAFYKNRYTADISKCPEPSRPRGKKKYKKHYFIFSRMTMVKDGEQKTFCVGSCHLPSRKTDTPVNQLIQAGNVVRHFQAFCRGPDDSHPPAAGILAGDFAMPEGELAYGLVREGKIKNDKQGSDYFVRTSTSGMKSAFPKKKPRKPSSTLAHGSQPLKDYIFCTEDVVVERSYEIERPEDDGSQRVQTACSTMMHSSSHFLIGATLIVPLTSVTSTIGRRARRHNPMDEPGNG